MKPAGTSTSRPRPAIGASLAALVVLGVGACSSDPEATPASDVEDASSDAAPPSDAGTDDAAATGVSKPVKDVTWIVGDAPASWTKREVGDGEKQWEVRGECLFTMDQPSGIDPDQVPVNQVLQDTGTKIQNALGFAIESGPVSTQAFPVTDNAEGVTSVDVSTIDYTSQAGASGSIYAYREGEYALIIYTACSANVPFAEVDEQDFAPFIEEQVSINLRY